jgi:SAM-dependent methyltransferase
MTAPPSDWIVRWAHLIPAGARVLDVACGSGRHLRWLARQRGDLHLTGVDRDAAAVEPLQSLARVVVADIENGPWPFANERFDAVIVTNYLWRPLLPTLIQAVAPGGVLLYETFASGNERFGRPSRADFLLRPGELLDAVGTDLQVLGYESGRLSQPDRVVQRLTARRAAPELADDTPAPLPEYPQRPG